MVLLKIAQIKKQLDSSESTVPPAYGIDLFVKGDQSGNSPVATYKNAAALGVCEQTVLHTGSFAELPFSDGAFSLVTGSLSIHNADKATRKKAIGEAARVLKSGGYLVVVDMAGYVSEYLNTVKEMGWTDVSSEFGGMRIMYGAWPCQILRARKP
jgi:SAM-dependent methyltransferase